MSNPLTLSFLQFIKRGPYTRYCLLSRLGSEKTEVSDTNTKSFTPDTSRYSYRKPYEQFLRLRNQGRTW